MDALMARFEEIEFENLRAFRKGALRLSNRGVVLVQGENRDTTSASSNGASKSTLISDALTYPLFGKDILGRGGDRLLRRGENRLRSAISFYSQSGDRYDVERNYCPRGGGKPALTLLKNGYPEGESGGKDEALEEASGFNFHAWRSSIVFGQGDHDRFGEESSTDADQKAILRAVLGLEDYSRALTQVRKLRSGKAEIVQDLETKVSYRRGLLAGLPDPSKLRSEIAALKALASPGDAVGRIHQLQERRNKAELLLSQLGKLREERDLLKVRASKIAVAAAEKQGELNVLHSREQAATQEHDLFRGGKCPTCETSSTAPSVREKLGGILGRLATIREQADARRAELATLGAEQETFRAQIDKLNARLAEEPKWKEFLAAQDEKIATERKALELSQNAAQQLYVKTGELEELEGKIRQAEDTLNRLIERLSAAETELRHYDFWVKGFGNQGLPSFLMGAMIPDIISRSNYYLDILTDGYIQVSLEDVSKTKKGEERNKFRRYVTVGGVNDVDPSGAENRKISVSIDLAFLDLSMARNRGSNIVVLDEVLDGLDGVGKQRVEQLLACVRQERESIFVVSHDPWMKEWFERTITVIRENGEARIVESN